MALIQKNSKEGDYIHKNGKNKTIKSRGKRMKNKLNIRMNSESKRQIIAQAEYEGYEKGRKEERDACIKDEIKFLENNLLSEKPNKDCWICGTIRGLIKRRIEKLKQRLTSEGSEDENGNK